MPTRKAPPTKQPLRLERFYTVKEAAAWFKLDGSDNPNKQDSQGGERWLRDGVNRPEDGSKGTPFPHHRIGRRLLFSESDLAQIAAMHRNAPTQGARRGSRRAPRKQAPTPIARTATEAELEPAA
jgi:hypothetical protein